MEVWEIKHYHNMQINNVDFAEMLTKEKSCWTILRMVKINSAT